MSDPIALPTEPTPSAQPGATPQATPAAQPSGDRPGWLPEKFKSPEDMAAAYSELEKKLGAGTPATPAAPAQDDPPGATTETLDDLVSKATEAFNESGAIPEDILKAFQKSGISPGYVQELVEGRKAKADSYTKTLYDTIGGPEAWKEMSAWAVQNMSSDERQAFNDAMNSGNLGQAKLALYGVQAQFKAATTGPRANLQVPSGQPGASAGFSSKAEMLSAMKDPKYAQDEAFRQSVMLRLKATPESITSQL